MQHAQALTCMKRSTHHLGSILASYDTAAELTGIDMRGHAQYSMSIDANAYVVHAAATQL